MAVAQRVKAESTDLVIIETLTPAIVFAPGGVNDILDKITREVRSAHIDISSKAGRDAVASLAYKVARSKTALDEMGKTLVAEWKTKASAVDAERRVIRDKLDDLKDEVRKPLTDWENAEKDRLADHEQAILAIEGMADWFGVAPSAADIKFRLDAFEALPPREWEEFAKRASLAEAQASTTLRRMHAEAVKREAEAAELARFRAEQAVREVREREERITAEAAERSRIEAETRAARLAEETAAKAKSDQDRVEREKAEAIARAERAEAEKKAAAAKAERDAKEAAARAERDRAAAIEAERKRVAETAAKAAADTAKREANKRHLTKINNEVLAALVAKGIDAEIGKMVIAAIARGEIPHTKIAY